MSDKIKRTQKEIDEMKGICMGKIKSMRQFQERYFPKSVGKVCPYCDKDLEPPLSPFRRAEIPWLTKDEPEDAPMDERNVEG